MCAHPPTTPACYCQVGVPSDRDQYIHRLGRTGRAGRAGSCVLLLSDFESGFINKLQGLPLTELAPHSGQSLSAIQQHVAAAFTRVSRQQRVGLGPGSACEPVHDLCSDSQCARICVGHACGLGHARGLKYARGLGHARGLQEGEQQRLGLLPSCLTSA